MSQPPPQQQQQQQYPPLNGGRGGGGGRGQPYGGRGGSSGGGPSNGGNSYGGQQQQHQQRPMVGAWQATPPPTQQPPQHQQQPASSLQAAAYGGGGGSVAPPSIPGGAAASAAVTTGGGTRGAQPQRGPPQQQQHHVPQQHYGQPQQQQPPGGVVPQQQYYNPYAPHVVVAAQQQTGMHQQHHGQQHQQGGHPGGNPYAGRPGTGAGGWTPTGVPMQQPVPGGGGGGGYNPNMRGGGVYYPPGGGAGMPSHIQQQQQQQQQAMLQHQQMLMQQQQPQPVAQPPAPAPRVKKPLEIRDKHGNVIDFSSMKPKTSLQAAAAVAGSATTPAATTLSSTAPSEAAAAAAADATTAAAAAAAVTPTPPPVVSNFGAKMREAALAKIHAEENAKKEAAEKKAKEEAEKAKKVKEEAEAAANKAKEEDAEQKTKAKAEAAALLKAKEEAEATQKAKEDEAAATLAAAAKKAVVEPDKPPKATSSLAAMLAKPSTTTAAAAVAAVAPLPPPGLAAPPGMAAATTTTTTTADATSSSTSASGRIVFSKDQLLQFQNLASCSRRPAGLPDMTIAKGQQATRTRSGGGGGGGSGGGGGGASRRDSGRSDSGRNDGGGGGGGSWDRGNAPPRRQSSISDKQQGGGGSGVGGGGIGGGSEWKRGQAPPKQQNNQQQGGKGGGKGGQQQQQQRGSNRGGPQGFYDGPVAPLTKSENSWKPKKDTSAQAVAEKKVKAILNKMTKEKFAKLAQQMVEIPIRSYEMLTMMIENVYDKAIDEPSFGDMYADLCVRLSQSAKSGEFVHIIESDEEPPTESGDAAPVSPKGGESSHNTVYRWSNDVGTGDDEIVGPFDSAEDCINVALDQENQPSPGQRGSLELDLVQVLIKQGVFIKIMKKKEAEEGESDVFYVVYFPVTDAEECGQQLSEIFLSSPEAVSDGNKKNSFKRSLLNKCEEEFNKQDIYVDLKKEKKEYEAIKHTLKDSERAEKEEEFAFRRVRIKKQMLGNVKFIGQLYKKNLLKEKIMRYCFASLIKLDELKTEPGRKAAKNPDYKDSGQYDLDEEDHEAICSLFATIGSTIDTPSSADFVTVCFNKITKLSNDKALPSRSRFMYKDLLELRANQWVPRRKEEKAKTLEEIRKDVELEERKQAQQSERDNRMNNSNSNRGGYSPRTGGPGGGGGGRGGAGGGGGVGRASSSGDVRSQQQSFARPRQPKPVLQTDADGFTVIASGSTKGVPPLATGPRASQPAAPPLPPGVKSFDASPAASPKDGPAPLDDDILERRIKSMRTDFMGDGGNVDELLLSWTEISGTPDAGQKLVQQTVDGMMECKEGERLAGIKVIAILAEKGKLTTKDVEDGMNDCIEFIDSMVCDSPRAFEYLGDVLAPLLRIGTIDVPWLCDSCEKTKVSDPNTQAPEKIIHATLAALKKTTGPDAAVAKGKFTANETALKKLLSASTWKTISQELL